MSDSLAFKYFPWQYWRPSGVNAEFDPSQANTATQNARALLIGQISSHGLPSRNKLRLSKVRAWPPGAVAVPR